MIALFQPPAAERRILGQRPLRSIIPWIVAVMSFTILLVAAAGLAVSHAAGSLGDAIEHRYALSVPDGGGQSAAIARRLESIDGVTSVEPVSERAMRDTLRRWLGPAADSRDLPVPALINFDVDVGTDPTEIAGAVRRLAPNAELSAHGDSIAPLLGSLRLLQWITLALVLLLGAAACAAVVLAARAAMDSHRATVAVLHGIGATDRQVTRLFQYRIALDTLAGSLAGAGIAALVLAVAASGAWWASELGGIALGPADAGILVLLPLLLTVVGTIAARHAILSALREDL